jgi:hypothetical protein
MWSQFPPEKGMKNTPTKDRVISRSIIYIRPLHIRIQINALERGEKCMGKMKLNKGVLSSKIPYRWDVNRYTYIISITTELLVT